MACVSCDSLNVRVYPAELNIHYPGREGIDLPTVWAFPSLLVCLDCGVTKFTLAEDQVRELKSHSRSDAATA